jgi:hypothetical protein
MDVVVDIQISNTKVTIFGEGNGPLCRLEGIDVVLVLVFSISGKDIFGE